MMSLPHASLSAFVLAGGRSSRMGTDKALLRLCGKPLIKHCVAKLRLLTHDVRILSSEAALASYAPLLADIHPNIGPIGGLESALAHTTTDWNLFLPVDMPFLPADLLGLWLKHALIAPAAARIHLLQTEDGRAQPCPCLLHRQLLPHLSQAIARSEYKLMQAFQSANVEVSITPLDEFTGTLTPRQRAAQHLWFANLNTPQDVAEAEANCLALDPIPGVIRAADAS
ncbi:MAG TPA: molybdenum cofactor guanylyltransferase [Acidobacteriaceae bacterium]|nr:molybdenum cofactor guanylyltransferase [Acidobacteriaceae bacterium]